MSTGFLNIFGAVIFMVLFFLTNDLSMALLAIINMLMAIWLKMK